MCAFFFSCLKHLGYEIEGFVESMQTEWDASIVRAMGCIRHHEGVFCCCEITEMIKNLSEMNTTARGASIERAMGCLRCHERDCAIT